MKRIRNMQEHFHADVKKAAEKGLLVQLFIAFINSNIAYMAMERPKTEYGRAHRNSAINANNRVGYLFFDHIVPLLDHIDQWDVFQHLWRTYLKRGFHRYSELLEEKADQFKASFDHDAYELAVTIRDIRQSINFYDLTDKVRRLMEKWNAEIVLSPEIARVLLDYYDGRDSDHSLEQFVLKMGSIPNGLTDEQLAGVILGLDDIRHEFSPERAEQIRLLKAHNAYIVRLLEEQLEYAT